MFVFAIKCAGTVYYLRSYKLRDVTGRSRPFPRIPYVMYDIHLTPNANRAQVFGMAHAVTLANSAEMSDAFWLMFHPRRFNFYPHRERGVSYVSSRIGLLLNHDLLPKRTDARFLDLKSIK